MQISNAERGNIDKRSNKSYSSSKTDLTDTQSPFSLRYEMNENEKILGEVSLKLSFHRILIFYHKGDSLNRTKV